MNLRAKLVKNGFPKLIAALHTESKVAERLTAREIAARARTAAPVRTGKLRGSVRARGNTVETSIVYAPYQEYGTRKMQAHPFFFEAVEGERPRFMARLRAVIKRFG